MPYFFEYKAFTHHEKLSMGDGGTDRHSDRHSKMIFECYLQKY